MRRQTARTCSSVACDCITTNMAGSPEWKRDRECTASPEGEQTAAGVLRAEGIATPFLCPGEFRGRMMCVQRAGKCSPTSLRTYHRATILSKQANMTPPAKGRSMLLIWFYLFSLVGYGKVCCGHFSWHRARIGIPCPFKLGQRRCPFVAEQCRCIKVASRFEVQVTCSPKFSPAKT
jgi:hypothetical protein